MLKVFIEYTRKYKMAILVLIKLEIELYQWSLPRELGIIKERIGKTLNWTL